MGDSQSFNFVPIDELIAISQWLLHQMGKHSPLQPPSPEAFNIRCLLTLVMQSVKHWRPTVSARRLVSLVSGNTAWDRNSADNSRPQKCQKCEIFWHQWRSNSSPLLLLYTEVQPVVVETGATCGGWDWGQMSGSGDCHASHNMTTAVTLLAFCDILISGLFCLCILGDLDHCWTKTGKQFHISGLDISKQVANESYAYWVTTHWIVMTHKSSRLCFILSLVEILLNQIQQSRRGGEAYKCSIQHFHHSQAKTVLMLDCSYLGILIVWMLNYASVPACLPIKVQELNCLGLGFEDASLCLGVGAFLFLCWLSFLLVPLEMLVWCPFH